MSQSSRNGDRIEGVPEGYRLKRIGRATNGEYFITHGCGVMKWTESMETVDVYPILELIPIEPEQPKQLEAVIVVEIGLEQPVIPKALDLAIWSDVEEAGFKVSSVTIREKG